MTIQRFTISVVLTLLATASHGFPRNTVPVQLSPDDEQVNTFTVGEQTYADSAMAADGSFVVVWQSEGWDDALGLTVLGRRFDSSGAPLGEEFRISTDTVIDNQLPAVASGPDGAFVVVWERPGDSPGSYYIEGRRYDSTGNPEGSFVPGATTEDARNPDVARVDDGSFLVVWDELASAEGVDGREIVARYYDSAGSPVAGTFQINTYTTGDQARPSTAGTSQFVVAWESPGAPGYTTPGVSMRRVSADGMAVAGESRVGGGVTEEILGLPSTSMASSGDFAVSWTAESPISPGSSILGVNRYGADGTQEFFNLPAGTISSVMHSSVALDEQGRLMLVWNNRAASTVNGYIYQAVQESGTVGGTGFTVSNGDAETRLFPVLANAGNKSVVTWHSPESGGTDTDILSIQSRELSLGIFQDGFELGTANWSQVVP